MLRPIDIQSQFSQSPLLSNRQQIANEQSTHQQQQFTQLMQKELAHNQEVIIKISHNEKIDNNKQNENKFKQQKKKSSNKEKDSDESISNRQNQIDIRL